MLLRRVAHNKILLIKTVFNERRRKMCGSVKNLIPAGCILWTSRVHMWKQYKLLTVWCNYTINRDETSEIMTRSESDRLSWHWPWTDERGRCVPAAAAGRPHHRRVEETLDRSERVTAAMRCRSRAVYCEAALWTNNRPQGGYKVGEKNCLSFSGFSRAINLLFHRLSQQKIYVIMTFVKGHGDPVYSVNSCFTQIFEW